MEEHLIKEVGRRFRRMRAAKRIVEVRQFMGKSEARRELMEKMFPELYQEAITPTPRPSGASSSESTRSVELPARPR